MGVKICKCGNEIEPKVIKTKLVIGEKQQDIEVLEYNCEKCKMKEIEFLSLEPILQKGRMEIIQKTNFILINKMPNVLKENNIPYKELTHLFNVSDQRISALVNGISPPNILTMLQIAYLIGCNVDDLVEIVPLGEKKLAKILATDINYEINEDLYLLYRELIKIKDYKKKGASNSDKNKELTQKANQLSEEIQFIKDCESLERRLEKTLGVEEGNKRIQEYKEQYANKYNSKNKIKTLVKNDTIINKDNWVVIEQLKDIYN